MARYKIADGELIPTHRGGRETRGKRYPALDSTSRPVPTQATQAAERPTRRPKREKPVLPPPVPAAPTGRPRRGVRRNAARDAAEAGVKFVAPPIKERRPGRQVPQAASVGGPAPTADDTKAGPASPADDLPRCHYCDKVLVNKRAGAKFCSTNCKALFSYHKGPKQD